MLTSIDFRSADDIQLLHHFMFGFIVRLRINSFCNMELESPAKRIYFIPFIDVDA